MYPADGQVIGLKKIWRYRNIVEKLVAGQALATEDVEFLKREGIGGMDR
jgi:hypothetical protein